MSSGDVDRACTKETTPTVQNQGHPSLEAVKSHGDHTSEQTDDWEIPNSSYSVELHKAQNLGKQLPIETPVSESRIRHASRCLM